MPQWPEASPLKLLPPLIVEPLDDTGATITVAQPVPGAFGDVERVDTPGQATERP